MIRRQPRSTRTDTLVPYTTLCRSRKVDFEIAFIAAGVPEAAALFVEPADSGDSYYFSPEASRIFGSELDAVRADSCPPPPEGRVNIAVGDRRAIKQIGRATD